ncbi:MAG: NADH-quinone oxidoreductase subunit L [Chloroflexi bacterium]|nr:NADH-quinone oxidoreductase subunit L [Chloroflexota bacterium]
MLSYLWLIPLFPLLSLLIITFFTLKRPRLSGYVTIVSIFGSFILSCLVLWLMLTGQFGSGGEHGRVLETSIAWFTIGQTQFHLGLLLDPLTAVMLIVVSAVSLVVQIYSQGYMAADPGYSRYFAFMSLFTMSMLGLVLANNFLMIYITWELVGLCSYLLIGFWYAKPEAAAAAKKAFIVTRFGDLGFLIGILILFYYTHTFNFTEVFRQAAGLGSTVLTLTAVLIFCGAIGKSAQFPLHVWLPDAMEGPTPVSALIHAATMVAAGVYLVARTMPLFAQSPEAMLVVASIGGFTALFAATMGLVMNDIKRVLAYSTISQLGYMMLGLGMGGSVAGIFHLMNHGFFKALLFLGAGSVMHSTGTADMRSMGGLRRVMPITFWTFAIASLSLAGIFPFSGFWSKDEILADALHGGQWLLFAMGIAGACLTAFYMFRIIFLTFFGVYRGHGVVAQPATAEHTSRRFSALAQTLEEKKDQTHTEHLGRLHESPWVMTIPLILLAIPSILSGLINVNGDFARFMGESKHVAVDPVVVGVSMSAALLGILLAYAMYSARWVSAERVGRTFAPIYNTLSHKYWFDDFYQAIIDKVVLGLSFAAQWFDLVVIDGIADGLGYALLATGRGLSRIETGRLQNYALAIFAGVAVIVGWLFLTGVIR